MSAVGPAPSCPESRVPESPSLEFRSPPRPLREDGTPRRVGVEIEFTGPSARIAAAALAAGLGGRLAEEDPHAFRLEGTSLGDLRVELDLRAAHPQRRMTEPGALPRLPVRAAGRSLAALLGPVVPRELITGPLAFDRLPEVDRLAALLHGAGGRGRGAVLLGSLGLHFNVEPPDLTAATLTGLLKAYLRSEPQLRRETAAGGFLAPAGCRRPSPRLTPPRCSIPPIGPTSTASPAIIWRPTRPATAASTSCRSSPTATRPACGPPCRRTRR